MKPIIRMVVIMMTSLCIFTSVLGSHSNGLHLQLPTQTIDINYIDIEELQVFQINSNQAGIMIRLKSNAAKKLTALTEPLIGQTIVWIWDGRVIALEKLQAPLGKDLNIFNFKKYEAEEFAQHVH